MRKLSAIVTTYNEIRHIREVLESMRFADELIVVDSGSDDGTVEAARGIADEILYRQYDSPAKQKNWAIPQAKHDWILILDADERVTPELQKEVEQVLSRDEIQEDGFWIYRDNIFLGKRVRYGGRQRDKVIRLIRKDLRYHDVQVHEEIDGGGHRIGKLKAKLDHDSAADLDHYIDKQNRYARWAAGELYKKGLKPNLWHFWVKPAFRFMKQFVFQLGFLDGKAGYLASRIDAQTVYNRFVELRRLHAEDQHRETQV